MKEKKKFLIEILVALLIINPLITGCIEEKPEEDEDITEPLAPPPPTYYSLNISIVGNGTTRPSLGTYRYPGRYNVTIKAIPDAGWKFSNWSGNITSSENLITITMDSGKKVTAYFEEIPPVEYTLTIDVSGQGTTNPGRGNHKCLEGSRLTIEAIPYSGWQFGYWSDDATGNQNPITITIDSDKKVTAHFNKKTNPPAPPPPPPPPPPSHYDLTIQVNGQGTTNPSPGVHSYLEGTNVAITATPYSGWQFSHWTGDASGSQNPITVTMTSDKEVTAHFEEMPVYELIIRVSGNGTTNPNPGSHNYTEGTQVSITAIPNTNWQFDYWSGDDNGSQNPITITMDSDKEVTARFKPPYKIHGINFSPYTKIGQNPNTGTVISIEQIRELMTVVANYTDWVRTFGTTNGLENASSVAQELNLNIAVGAWLSDDLDSNEEQISNLITIAQAGEADMLIVGSEVLLRHDLTGSQLIEYINRVKGNTSGIPVTTADVYSELLEHQNVMDACDVIMVNHYPYWEGVTIDYAVYYIHIRHQQVVAAAGNKSVIVSETGWPSDGNSVGNAVPSPENASFFFLNFVTWANTENVPYFYFEAFDEPWKVGYEGPQGAHWGVWDRYGYLKSGMEKVFNGENTSHTWETEVINGTGNATIEFTYVPPYGNHFDNLEGRVEHVSPVDCRIAVYIKVDNKWWTKPFWNDPLTIIWPNGNWTCDITTGGHDYLATEIIAFLLLAGYDPPLMHGGSTLPQELYDNALTYVNVTRI